MNQESRTEGYNDAEVTNRTRRDSVPVPGENGQQQAVTATQKDVVVQFARRRRRVAKYHTTLERAPH